MFLRQVRTRGGLRRLLSDLSYQMDRFKDLNKGIPRRLRQQLEFILEIDALKGVLRRSYLIGDHRHENSAEHSWHLAVAAMVSAEHAKNGSMSAK